ncbi:MmcQ/YjbR family DNA-binding protein [Streptomonospora algeriensis]
MADWEQVVAIGRGLAEVEESTSYNTAALKVGGRMFVRLRAEAEGVLVVMCGLDEKQALLASGDPAFFTTAHYDGYGAILVDLERVEGCELAELVTEAWRIKAPARLREAFDAR